MVVAPVSYTHLDVYKRQVFDRGGSADKILDLLYDYHSLDIEWGNHDILCQLHLPQYADGQQQAS